MFRFAFLGTSGAIQHQGSDNASLVFDFKGQLVLVDISGSAGMKLRALGCDIKGLDALLITHSHIDHIYGFPSLIHQMWLLGRKIPFYVYGTADVVGLCSELIRLFELDKKKGMFEICFKTINEGHVFEEDGFSVHCQAVHHGVPALAFRLDLQGQPLLYYSGDTVFETEYAGFAAGCQVIIHEAATLADCGEITRQKGHSTAHEAGIFAKLCGASQLYMFHFDVAYEGELHRFIDEAGAEFSGDIVVPEPLRWYSVDL